MLAAIKSLKTRSIDVLSCHPTREPRSIKLLIKKMDGLLVVAALETAAVKLRQLTLFTLLLHSLNVGTASVLHGLWPIDKTVYTRAATHSCFP